MNLPEMNIVELNGLSDQITRLFLSNLYLEVSSPDVDLLEAGVLDSALVVEILLLLEQEFDVNIAIETLELDSVRSIRNIANLVANYGSAKL